MESIHEGSCGSQFYRTGGFFSRLPLSALESFRAMEHTSSYPAGVVLFAEGEPVKGLFVVLSGEVRLSINSSEGRRLSLRIAREGDIIGLSPVLSGAPYDMTAETLYPSKVAPIGRSDFLRFLARHPESYQAVTEELARHVAEACSQLRTLGLCTTAPEKLARLLLEWSDRGHATESESSLRFSLTHEQIGDFIGTSRETVTRTLNLFKSRRLVALNGSTMTIPNRSALADYARAQSYN
jgi:CRP/FNR family transcriptional regulator